MRPTPTPQTIDTPGGAASLGTVLGVWAHPDDEAYLSAGLMALARDAGNRVTCVTATRGEHGAADPVAWPPSRLARTRELEAAACMAVLGVDDHRFLTYEDGTLDRQDPEIGAQTIAELIVEVGADTIVTFGPDGMTGHADHRTISAWTTDAWALTGGTARLLYATTSATFADEFADLHERIPVFGPGLPLRTAAADLALTVALDDGLLDRKLAALRAQASQVQELVGEIGVDRFRQWWRNETFRDPCLYSPRPEKKGRSDQDPHHVAGGLRGGARGHRRA